MHKPILCLDFDGVIHSYSSGWKGAAAIPDPLVPGSIEFIRSALKKFRVAIYSSRSGQEGGIAAMQEYIRVAAEAPSWGEGDFAWIDEIEWPTEKPPAMVTIDDRALTFTGDWRDFPLDKLADFQPWNKR